ncbi:hypothetical protein RUM43_005861 [Polyplax serrata]|uniref:Uncharacterized protein n=1 Tax=Polyplax serrata TaxID=468196 RepID=A0AAN8NQZ4_POLSC
MGIIVQKSDAFMSNIIFGDVVKPLNGIAYDLTGRNHGGGSMRGTSWVVINADVPDSRRRTCRYQSDTVPGECGTHTGIFKWFVQQNYPNDNNDKCSRNLRKKAYVEIHFNLRPHAHIDIKTTTSKVSMTYI